MLSLVSNSIRFQELRQAAFPNLQYITFLCFFTAFWTLQGKTQWDPEKQNMPLFSCWLGRDGPPVKPLIPYISKPLGSSTCGKFFSYISIYFKNIYWKNLHNFECNRKNTVKADSRSKKKATLQVRLQAPASEQTMLPVTQGLPRAHDTCLPQRQSHPAAVWLQMAHIP